MDSGKEKVKFWRLWNLFSGPPIVFERTELKMKFIGIRKVFSTKNEEQYSTIGAFWDEMSAIYGRENLMGLGCNWTSDSIEYVMALKNGIIEGADYEIELPDEWKTVRGRTEELGKIYGDIYKDGVL